MQGWGIYIADGGETFFCCRRFGHDVVVPAAYGMQLAVDKIACKKGSFLLPGTKQLKMVAGYGSLYLDGVTQGLD